MAFYQKTTLRIKSNILDLSTPIVMGILNLTEDSFYQNSRVSSEKELVEKAATMIADGATILDLGAMSSRPGAVDLGQDHELERLLPAIDRLKLEFPNTILSIDTYRAEVAKRCVHFGAEIINDISAGTADPKMMSTMVELNVPYIMMHMKGTPDNMQDNPEYEDVVREVYSFLHYQSKLFMEAGVHDIILDPGFGFGKSLEHNYELLDNIDHFKNIGLPVLVGISRKSMVYKPLGITPEESLPATSALHMLALDKGASILRVHDVKEAMDVINAYKDSLTSLS